MHVQSVVSLSLIAALLTFSSGSVQASETTIIVEEQYVMGDNDTLTMAEERVLQRAQRRAVEEAGMYLESTFHDREEIIHGRSIQSSSLEIRTIASAITKTEILEFRRFIQHDRPSFSIRIRAVVDLENLRTAIQRWQSEQQLAEHFRQLQKENLHLRAQLNELKAPRTGVSTLNIASQNHKAAHKQAQEYIERAIQTQNLRQKLDLASQAAIMDPQSVDPLIVRGQTYLRLASVAYSNATKPSDYSEYIDNARMDFDRALLIDDKNTWALLGLGDVNAWLHRPEEAIRLFEQVLALDPFFDVARQHLIALCTAEARKLVAQKQWSSALSILRKILGAQPSDSWLPDQKEAYLLRSDIYKKLNRPTQAIDDLGMVLRLEPTNTQVLLARAKLYLDQLQGSSAKDDFERACLLGTTEACNRLP